MGQEVKKYFKHFMIPLIIIGVLAVICVVVKYMDASKSEEPYYYDSTNTERVYPNQRVFDKADMLTDAEEASLEAYIAEKEKVTLTDIVIVTLNEPLENYEVEYRSRYSINVTPDKWVMVYADKFWEDNKFGYDQPQVLDGSTYSGDGVILVDNNYREGPDNRIYTWLGTTGLAETELSSSEIDAILDAFYDEVDYNYYQACIDFVDKYVRTICPEQYKSTNKMDLRYGLVIAAVAMIIYIAVNWKTKSGKVTVTAKTYLISGSSLFPVSNDIFIRKSVSKTRISSESSVGGGGGHHTSGGGGSHGGGGHSR